MGVMRTLVISLFALVEIIVAGCAGEEGAAASGAPGFAASSRSCKRRAVADSISSRAAPIATGLIKSR